MKRLHTLLGAVLLVAASFSAQGQDNLLDTYLQNDCEDLVLEQAIVENAENWQEDLIRVAFNGPSQDKVTAQREYLNKRYAILKDAAQNKDYSWMTDEYRKELLSISQEEFVGRELNSFTTKYKEQALHGLELLRANGLLDETREMNVELSPNPTVDQLTNAATLASESDYLVSIMDFAGNQVSNSIQGQGSSVNHEIAVGHLSAGEYLVQVVSSNGAIVTKKFVVVK